MGFIDKIIAVMLGASISVNVYPCAYYLNKSGMVNPSSITQEYYDFTKININADNYIEQSYSKLESLDRVDMFLNKLATRYKVNIDIVKSIFSYEYENTNKENLETTKEVIEKLTEQLKDSLIYYNGNYLLAIQSLYSDRQEIDYTYFTNKHNWIYRLNGEKYGKLEVLEILKYYVGLKS